MGSGKEPLKIPLPLLIPIMGIDGILGIVMVS